MRLAKKKITDLIAIVTKCLRFNKERVAIFNRKRIAALTVFAFCLTAVQGMANAAIIQIDENLDNNLVPSGFSLATTNTAGIANGRLQATATNGSAVLAYNTLPGNLNQIDISYRGHFGYSQWGTYTVVSFGDLPISLTHGVADAPGQYAVWGANNYASISGGGTSTSPFNYSIFEYSITVVEGQVSYTGTDSATGTQAFNLILADASIVLADINKISFRSHNTTGTEPVWLDDINMQLSTVPVPAAIWLFGTALIGLVGFGKRRKLA